MVVVISDDYLESDECDFQTKFALSLSPGKTPQLGHLKLCINISLLLPEFLQLRSGLYCWALPKCRMRGGLRCVYAEEINRGEEGEKKSLVGRELAARSQTWVPPVLCVGKQNMELDGKGP